MRRDRWPPAVAPPLQKQIRNAFRRDLRPLAQLRTRQAGVSLIPVRSFASKTPKVIALYSIFIAVFTKNTFFHTFLRFFALKIKQNRNSTPYIVQENYL
jgi:hypothetical protein